MKRVLALAALLSVFASHAADNGELWEVTTQMNMAGMPPGMGSQTHQVCNEKTADRKPVIPAREKCKVTDYKESGNRVTITMSCPDGTGVIEQTFNAARTEYKGTMKMKMRDGEMTMNMAGRKIGSCDAQQAKKARDDRQAAARQQMEQAQAQSTAAFASMTANQVAQCEEAVQTMDARKLGIYGTCEGQEETCKTMRSQDIYKNAAPKCTASRTEYCRRFQTMDGFLKAKGDEQAAKMCNVSVEKVKASQCPQAEKAENLDFLIRFCTTEARTVAQAHCAGREYTSRVQDKYTSYCAAYYTKYVDERPAKPASAPRSTEQAVQQGVQQGINKLKGLFGR